MLWKTAEVCLVMFVYSDLFSIPWCQSVAQSLFNVGAEQESNPDTTGSSQNDLNLVGIPLKRGASDSRR